MTDWSDWVRTITGDASSRSIAAKIGRSHPTAQSWKEKPPGPDGVRLLARMYGACVIDGFRAAGWLTDVDIARVRSLSGFSEIQLLAELQRRAKVRAAEEQGWVITG